MTKTKVLVIDICTFWSGNMISKFEVDGDHYVARLTRSSSDERVIAVISPSENEFDPVYVNDTGSSTMSTDILKEHIGIFVEELLIKKEREECYGRSFSTTEG